MNFSPVRRVIAYLRKKGLKFNIKDTPTVAELLETPKKTNLPPRLQFYSQVHRGRDSGRGSLAVYEREAEPNTLQRTRRRPATPAIPPYGHGLAVQDGGKGRQVPTA
jgi:hypothetical protein